MPLQARMEDIVFSESSFTFTRFLSQNMAMERLVAANLAFSSLSEPLGRSPVAFHFRHGPLPSYQPIKTTSFVLQKKAILFTLKMRHVQVKYNGFYLGRILPPLFRLVKDAESL